MTGTETGIVTETGTEIGTEIGIEIGVGMPGLDPEIVTETANEDPDLAIKRNAGKNAIVTMIARSRREVIDQEVNQEVDLDLNLDPADDRE